MPTEDKHLVLVGRGRTEEEEGKGGEEPYRDTSYLVSHTCTTSNSRSHCAGCHGYLEEGGESCSIEAHSEILELCTDLTHYVGVETGNCFLRESCVCTSNNTKTNHNTTLIMCSVQWV